MKKILMNVLVMLLVVSMSSCYTYTFNIGKGAQGSAKVTQKNHYFIYGLAQGKTSDPQQMAAGATDYTVTVQHTFLDGLLNGITFGIYNPTTTTVTK